MNKDIIHLDEKARLILIASAITKGKRKCDIIEEYCKEWGVGEKFVEFIYKQAFDIIKDPERRENIRDLNLARLEDIYREAREKKDNALALKTINLINKTCNVYTQQIELTSGDGSFEFDFKLKEDQ